MRITTVNIPKSEDNSDGLEAIKMDRLSQVVLITGKNGSGKTRVLNKIFGIFGQKPTRSQIDNATITIGTLQTYLQSEETNIQSYQSQISQSADQHQINNLKLYLKQSGESFISWKNQIQTYSDQLNWHLIETDIHAEQYKSLNYVPKQLGLFDCNQFNTMQLRSEAANSKNLGVNNFSSSAFATIQHIQNLWYEATHQHFEGTEEDKDSSIEDYNSLKEFIYIFLNTEISRKNGDATLFGFPLGQTNLSDGQKILLQFCLAIYRQKTALKDLILVMDEPENHLHPSVIIETIDRIKECVPEGQIWIATHSIPLLAHYDPSQIWFVENGKISHAGKIPEKVLASLLGDEDEIARLQDFISLPAQYASNRYAFECLFEPITVQTEAKDPQSMQIRNALLAHSANKDRLRVLDFGAGKGRLLANIADLEDANRAELVSKLDYIAFDKFANDKEACESVLNKVYGDCNNRYFNNFDTLLSTYDAGKFDVVIMCNVLHEIESNDWLKLFKAGGTISKLLHDNGILLLVEDQQIPTGEKAYQNGFLVLDTLQLKTLFKISETDKDFLIHDAKSDGRLKAHHIPKRLLIQIDEESRVAAIKSLSETAKENILDIRKNITNYKNGKLHGFWTQQFANAQLCLSVLTTN